MLSQCRSTSPTLWRRGRRRLSAERIAEADAEDLLPMVQTFGVHQCRTSSCRRNHDHRNPERQLRPASQPDRSPHDTS